MQRVGRSFLPLGRLLRRLRLDQPAIARVALAGLEFGKPTEPCAGGGQQGGTGLRPKLQLRVVMRR